MSNSNYPEPMDLSTLRTYSLADRPSKVFADDLGKPIGAGATVSQWLDALPKQLAANSLRRVRDELVRARLEGRQVVAAIGGHVIKVGCAPYLNSWLNQGVLTAVAMNGAAAIHDFELAYRGRTSEDLAKPWENISKNSTRRANWPTLRQASSFRPTARERPAPSMWQLAPMWFICTRRFQGPTLERPPWSISEGCARW